MALTGHSPRCLRVMAAVMSGRISDAGVAVVRDVQAPAITQQLGPNFYGYGFASAMLLSCLVGLSLLSAKLDSLEYETFMMQRFA